MQLSAQMAMVGDQVSRFGKPAVLSLAEDTHLFHFNHAGDWRESPVVLVNRNGHHFRLLNGDSTTTWLYCKTWNSLTDYDDWMVQANLRRSDPEELIALCGVGPQGKQDFEALSLLPKQATTGRRKAVWRNHIMPVCFNMEANTFTLTSEDGQGGGGWSPAFKGKLWESREAAKWCLAELAGPSVAKATAVNPHVAAQELAELESNELWGMF